MRSLLLAFFCTSLVALSGAPSFAQADTIHACVKLNSGNIRIVGTNDTCSPSEAPLVWSQGTALRCPTGTTLFIGVCIENAPRAPLTQDLATRDCADEGRRLPSPSELQAFRELPGINVGAEWTDDVAGMTGAIFTYVVVSDVATGFDLGTFPNAYRCVAGPLVE